MKRNDPLEYGYQDDASKMRQAVNQESAKIDRALAETDFDLLFEEYELKYFAKGAYIQGDFVKSLRSAAVLAIEENSPLVGILYRIRNGTERVYSIAARVCRVDDLDRFVRAAACAAPSLKWVSGYNLSALCNENVDAKARNDLGNAMAGKGQRDYQTPSDLYVEGKMVTVASWSGRTKITVTARPEWGGYLVSVEWQEGSRNKADVTIRHLIENKWNSRVEVEVTWFDPNLHEINLRSFEDLSLDSTLAENLEKLPTPFGDDE